jgi:hypothetical protein
VADTLDTGPRSLVCTACLDETVHHFSHCEETQEGYLVWFGCERCGLLRSLDFVSRPAPLPQYTLRSSDDWWPMDLGPELGGGG